MKHEFKCLPGCSWCCGGQIQIPIETYQKHLNDRQREVLLEMEHPDTETVQALTLDGACVFLKSTNKCAIYNERPMVCRLYGLNRPCPFVRPDGTPRPKAEVEANMKKLDSTIRFAKKVLKI